MNICILADSFPSRDNNISVFVARLSEEFADLGHNVVYIAPQSITNCIIRRKKISSTFHIHKTKKQNDIKVFQPKIVTFSNLKYINRLNDYFIERAVSMVLKNLKNQPDVYYGHFWHNAYILFKLINKKKKYLFVATGESEITFNEKLSNKKKEEFKKYVKGIICVSSKNRDESIYKGLADINKCYVLPNAIDDNMFYKKNKSECRRRLGFPQNGFIISFVGRFTENKGFNKLLEAVNLINEDIYVLFIGSGASCPENPKILFAGFLQHEDINDYLNCSDIFVLPTLAEGCSNAIVEAMAAGLPIISSDLSFNYDILNESNSILIDPTNIIEISEAIIKLKNDILLRTKLSNGAIESSKKLLLKERAKKILNVISLHI
jgi:glycosyltransferase involved in cell wall biosynthesis